MKFAPLLLFSFSSVILFTAAPEAFGSFVHVVVLTSDEEEENGSTGIGNGPSDVARGGQIPRSLFSNYEANHPLMGGGDNSDFPASLFGQASQGLSSLGFQGPQNLFGLGGGGFSGIFEEFDTPVPTLPDFIPPGLNPSGPPGFDPPGPPEFVLPDAGFDPPGPPGFVPPGPPGFVPPGPPGFDPPGPPGFDPPGPPGFDPPGLADSGADPQQDGDVGVIPNPEPGSFLLFSLGMGALVMVGIARRRRSQTVTPA